mgnify:CR=1 FL=1
MSDIKSRIETLLEEFWAENVIEAEETGSVDDPLILVDSMTCVEALGLLEEEFDIKLSDDDIKSGGYENKEEFVSHLTELTCSTLEVK